jgi:chromate reductase
MSAPKILALAGSSRADSFNKKLVKIAADGARAAGAEVTLVDLKEYSIPLYDGDCEVALGVPESALKLRKLVDECDGLLIASPEYNGSVSALLKNVIDWISRPVAGLNPTPFKGKIGVLMSTSPGALGGLRGLMHVRSILSNLGTVVLPEQVAVGRAFSAFDEAGKLKDPDQHSSVVLLGTRVAKVASALRPTLKSFN